MGGIHIDSNLFEISKTYQNSDDIVLMMLALGCLFTAVIVLSTSKNQIAIITSQLFFGKNQKKIIMVEKNQ